MSARRWVHLERILGRMVRDVHGRRVGHLEEIRVEQRAEGPVVVEILIGARGWLERLSLAHVWWPRAARGYRARWDQVDLRDERRPMLTCARSELASLEPRRGARV
jgi:hypothetical protein